MLPRAPAEAFLSLNLLFMLCTPWPLPNVLILLALLTMLVLVLLGLAFAEDGGKILMFGIWVLLKAVSTLQVTLGYSV